MVFWSDVHFKTLATCFQIVGRQDDSFVSIHLQCYHGIVERDVLVECEHHFVVFNRGDYAVVLRCHIAEVEHLGVNVILGSEVYLAVSGAIDVGAHHAGAAAYEFHFTVVVQGYQ